MNVQNAKALILNQPPNPPLNSDPACIAFRSFSSFRFLGFESLLLSSDAPVGRPDPPALTGKF